MTRRRINLPKSGMGIDEGTVAHWLKAIGDRVQQGEVIVEVETAKALQEVEAPASGILVEIHCGAGSTTPVNSTLGVIDDETA